MMCYFWQSLAQRVFIKYIAIEHAVVSRVDKYMYIPRGAEKKLIVSAVSREGATVFLSAVTLSKADRFLKTFVHLQIQQ